MKLQRKSDQARETTILWHFLGFTTSSCPCWLLLTEHHPWLHFHHQWFYMHTLANVMMVIRNCFPWRKHMLLTPLARPSAFLTFLNTSLDCCIMIGNHYRCGHTIGLIGIYCGFAIRNSLRETKILEYLVEVVLMTDKCTKTRQCWGVPVII